MKKLAVFSRHPSHNELRKAKIMLPKSVSIRFGSINLGHYLYEIVLNKPESVLISANKLLMKRAFNAANITTSRWYIASTISDGFVECIAENPNNNVITSIENMPFPIVAKHIFGSRGTGNFLLKTKEQLVSWLAGKTLTNYIFEKFYNYTREYRLHVSKNGCFYTCRKMLKNNTPAQNRWYRNDSNSVWVVEENPNFNKPANWSIIEEQCVNALSVIGLDLAAFDVKVAANETNDFIIIESNSAPSFGEKTLEHYIKEITKLTTN